jgi:pyrroline-5-carboxylate reductase
MNTKSIGFIGGGRITKIILHGWKRAKKLPSRIVVTDTTADILNNLKKEFPTIETAVINPTMPAGCDIVFIALHPHVIGDILQEIKSFIKPTALVVSLAPKISIDKISERLGGFKNIARIIPNAPSYINKGYNPVSFSPAISKEAKRITLELFGPLGDIPEVTEELLEAYALFTGMGPTYFWFQLYELQELIKSFGLSQQAIQDGLPKMLNGTVKTMFESGLASDDVMNLIPIKPLSEKEAIIKGFYKNRLTALYNKLKS